MDATRRDKRNVRSRPRRFFFCSLFRLIPAFLLLNVGEVRANNNSYVVDLAMLSDYEELRPLIDGCTDLGELEKQRRKLEPVNDLEDIRAFLETKREVVFRGCPRITIDSAKLIST